MLAVGASNFGRAVRGSWPIGTVCKATPIPPIFGDVTLLLTVADSRRVLLR